MIPGVDGSRMDPLRFAVLIDGRPLMSWEKAVLDQLAASGGGQLVAIVESTAPARRPTIKTLLRRAPYFVLRRFFARPTAWKLSCDPRTLGATRHMLVSPIDVGGGWQELPADIVEEVREMHLDFILRFGFGLLRGDALSAARLGVWSYHHGDVSEYRGRPAGFWELAHRRVIAGVTLQRLTTKLDGGVVLEGGFFKVDPWSWSSTLDNMYWGSVGLVARHCKRATLGGPAEADQVLLGPVYKLPDALTVIFTSALMLWALVRRLAYGAFVEKHWAVGLARRTPIDPPWCHAEVRWLRAPNRQGLADPCLANSQFPVRILCERLKNPHALGEIVCLEATADGTISKVALLLGGDNVHRSFPALYRDSAGTWIVPEQAEAGRLTAYRLSFEPTRVDEALVLLDGFAALDPAIFEAAGRLWLAVTFPGRAAQSALHLYHSERLGGPWHGHPMNPVVTDVRCARMAGQPFQWNNRLYRPGQDCSNKYGGRVRIMEVVHLDLHEYREREVAVLDPPTIGEGRDGMHTLSVGDELIALDACTERFSLLAGGRRFVRRLRRRR